LHDGVVGLDGPVQVAYPKGFSPSRKFWRTTPELGRNRQQGCTSRRLKRWRLDQSSLGRTWVCLSHPSPPLPILSLIYQAELFVLAGAEVRGILLEKGNASGEWKAKTVHARGGDCLAAPSSPPLASQRRSVRENLQDHLSASPLTLSMSSISATGLPTSSSPQANTRVLLRDTCESLRLVGRGRGRLLRFRLCGPGGGTFAWIRSQPRHLQARAAQCVHAADLVTP